MEARGCNPDEAPPHGVGCVRGGGGSLGVTAEDVVAREPGTSCNTLKDKGRQGGANATTAGIFAVTWACGITIGMAELYGAESTSQVYAILMTVFNTINHFPQRFFYDDGCHLAR